VAREIRILTASQAKGDALVDRFGRQVTYVRVSVTDRCDLRCRYCMGEAMEFLPRRDVLTFEDILLLTDIFIARGIRKLRLTGGEPLVRKGVIDLIGRLGDRLGGGLDELTLTTNGTRLACHAVDLHAAGIRRINVSLDSLRPERFRHITRRGNLALVLAGIDAAAAAGIAIKINMVGLKGVNDDEIEDVLLWCAERKFGLTLIETMPLGEVDEDRSVHFLPLDAVKRRLEQRFTLVPSLRTTGGPARYYDVPELGAQLGLITPLSTNFCSGCNRIRVAATGSVYGCLGRDQKVELRELIRAGGAESVHAALDLLLAGKPLGHDFRIGSGVPAVSRHMSVTGG
jgi:cyclic pyranopterin phosphate synthase